VNDKPLKVAVVGAGGIAQMMHLPTLAERPDLFEIAGVADVAPDTLQAVGRRYAIRVLSSDWREVVDRARPDAVLLLASGCHRDAMLDLLPMGLPIFVEKPLAFSLPETEEVVRAALERKATVMVGYHKRFDPAYLRARESVRELGGLRFVEVTVLHPDDGAYRTHHAVLPVPAGPRPARTEQEIENGTVAAVTSGPMRACVDRIVGAEAPLHVRVASFILFESLIHDIDALRGILGEPERVVSAHAWRGGFAQSSVTRFPGDLAVTLNWISLPGLRHYEERLRFVAPRGRVTLTFPSPYLRHLPTPLQVERMDGEELVVEDRTVSYEEAFRAELHHFRRCLLEGRPPTPSLDDALGDARWIQSIADAYPREAA
jgi:predicted dehydrogenase